MIIFRRHAARFAALAVLSVLTPRRAAPQAVVPPRADLAGIARRLEQVIAREMRDHGLPALSIALVDDQQVVWARGFGIADPADSTPATAETVYRVGSVSKLFTDVAIMQLVERGALDLDAPVNRYLPDFRPRNPYNKSVTLRQLMSHRSGLVREPPVGSYFDSTSPPLATTVASLNRTTLVYPPETRTKYSNAAIATVGFVLERTQGEPFARYLSRAVLAPLGMTRSGFELSPELQRGRAKAWMWTVDGRRFLAPTFELGMAPAGSMYSTVTDLGRFVSALFAGGRGVAGQVLAPETLARMWEPQFATASDPAGSGYGIGFRMGRFEGHRSIGHDGAIYGFATTLQALPDEKLGVVIATTLDGANAVIDRIADHALRAMLETRRASGSGVTVAGSATEDDSTTQVANDRSRALVGRYAPAAASSRELELLHRGTGLALLPAGGGALLELRARGDTLMVDDPVFGRGDRYLPHEGAAYLRGQRSGSASPGFVDTLRRVSRGRPSTPPSRWSGLVGEYGPDYDVLYIYERDGRLWTLIEWFFPYPLTEVARDTFAFPPAGLYDGEQLVFTRDTGGRAREVRAAGVRFARRSIEPKPGTNQLRITPVRPVAELRREALAAQPPEETGTFRDPELVELITLDPSIKLEIRYATSNNFLGTRVYDAPRAFMQRPAAVALVRAHRALAPLGFGLLIHDAYRPWYVTKIFWDATPPEKKWLVADPSQGSKHNRGSAVDLTLYELKTGRPVEMVSTYDESTDRAYAEYPGGTSLQRWHREILRQAMEAQGFLTNPQEWWHYDYRDWRQYRIGNQRLDTPGRD